MKPAVIAFQEIGAFPDFAAHCGKVMGTIFTSLFVWSVVTWLTGHARTLNELLAARAAMGISEACYLPAGLALIANYHGERTRSLATGIHYSGSYEGTILGGLAGGYLAQQYGWRWAFGIFGAIGVVYALMFPDGGHHGSSSN